MKSILIGALLLGIYVCEINMKAQIQSLSLSIETDKSSFKLGDDIDITILLKNNTDQSVDLSKIMRAGDGSFEYQVNVERDDHSEVAKKFAEKLHRHEVHPEIPPPGSVVFFTIEPGKTNKDSVTITNRYEIDKPGKYLVQLERALPEDIGGGVIKSNTITITVTP